MDNIKGYMFPIEFAKKIKRIIVTSNLNLVNSALGKDNVVLVSISPSPNYCEPFRYCLVELEE